MHIIVVVIIIIVKIIVIVIVIVIVIELEMFFETVLQLAASRYGSFRTLKENEIGGEAGDDDRCRRPGSLSYSYSRGVWVKSLCTTYTIPRQSL